MSDVTLKTEFKFQKNLLQKLLRKRTIRKLEETGEFVRADIVRRLSRGSSRNAPSQPGHPPHADTGRLRQSIVWIVNKNKLTVKIGTSVIYGRILELGGTIRPKTAGALSVPISDAAKRHRGSPTIFPKRLTLIRSGGRAYLIESKSRRTTIHYVLVKSVRIKARPYLRPAVTENLKNIEKLFGFKLKK